ncbi:MAG: Spy/CpxP family protein refolding chaperone [Acidobacteriia bacterium]|nr:Spy/CpxP family protein refolding chaperone [Terriglobia bacterium]
MIKARTAFAIAILLAVLLPLTMMAQTEAPPPQGQGQGMGEHHGHMGRMGEPSGQAHLDHLSRMLSLTDEQKAKVKPILDDVGAQALKIRQDTSLSPQDRMAKMRDLHEKAMTQVRGILTPEQQTKLDQMQNHEGMGHGKGMGHGQGMGPKDQGQQQTPPPQQ